MGAGNFPAGMGPQGLDPLPPPSPPRDVTIPAALYFDGRTQGFPLDAAGHYVGIHPVDQATALALIVRLGTLASAPTTGAGFRNIHKITKAAANTATSMAHAALASLVQAQDIQILSIQVETKRTQGAILIAVSYRNLRTLPPKPATITMNVNG